MRFGDPKAPLLVSVRSGARASMPGMMDTILNLGLNDDDRRRASPSAPATARFALDAYRRFIAMYSDVVLGVKREHFEHALDEARGARRARSSGIDATRLNAEELQRKVPDADIPRGRARDARRRRSRRSSKEKTRQGLPRRIPKEQLWGAIEAVFQRWNNHARHRLPQDARHPRELGHRVQRAGDGLRQPRRRPAPPASRSRAIRRPASARSSASGCRTRRARTSSPASARRCPLRARAQATTEDSLERRMPEALRGARRRSTQKLEKHFRDMQDLEFTIQEGKLYMLQCRTGKRTGTRRRAHRRRDGEGGPHHEGRGASCASIPTSLDQLLHPTLDPEGAEEAARARPRRRARAPRSGQVVFTADEAERRAGQGEPVILVRVETSPEDIHGMKAARGILTARGGMTSHAAVVARGMGKPCVAGCSALSVELRRADDDDHACTTTTAARPSTVTRQEGRHHHARRRHRPASTSARVPTVPAALTGEFGELMGWADAVRTHAGARQRRHAARRAHRAQLRRRGHRPLPHRAHVLRRGAHRAPCAR